MNLYWLYVDVVSIRVLFGMAGRPLSRPLGVDSGPGEDGPEEAWGPPNPLNIHIFVAIQVSATLMIG